MSLHHSFDIDIAQKYGVPVAIFLNHIAFWIQKNQANNKNIHNGRAWTYNSIEAFLIIFPYWTTDQMRGVIKKCIELDFVAKGNYNSKAYDRKYWYTLTDNGHKLLNLPIWEKSQMDSGKIPNGCGENPKPIADINTDTNTDNKTSISSNDEFDDFWNAYPKKTSKKAAMKAWKKIELKKYAEIIDDVNKRKDNNWKGKDKQYLPDPATYLNGERWNDEIYTNQENINGKQKSRATKSFELLTEIHTRELENERAARNQKSTQDMDYDPLCPLSIDLAQSNGISL